jgi:chemotaxis regulatin CheY-phosphate phosphatase CheZ
VTEPEQEAREIIATIRREVEQAADMMLSAAEKCLREVGAARSGQPAALDNIERTLCAILEACAFQDLTGQRLSKLNTMIAAVGLRAVPIDPLLNGPALAGEGLDQGAADAIFARGS